eukprot:7540126-Alexandrium_andersonii.AAC.1
MPDRAPTARLSCAIARAPREGAALRWLTAERRSPIQAAATSAQELAGTTCRMPSLACSWSPNGGL